MENFQTILEDCGLSDLMFRGPKFTLSNFQEGFSFTKERLDRVVANRDWCEHFNEADVLVGVAISSNHSPIFLNLLGQGSGRQRRRAFQYEVGWELDMHCREIIVKA